MRPSLRTPLARLCEIVESDPDLYDQLDKPCGPTRGRNRTTKAELLELLQSPKALREPAYEGGLRRTKLPEILPLPLPEWSPLDFWPATSGAGASVMRRITGHWQRQPSASTTLISPPVGSIASTELGVSTKMQATESPSITSKMPTTEPPAIASEVTKIQAAEPSPPTKPITPPKPKTTNVCSFDNIKDLIDPRTEPITVLNVYFACQAAGIPIREGLELWQELKKEHVEKEAHFLFAELASVENFIAAADRALTLTCKRQRTYKSDQNRFIEMLVEGSCNCSCGSQMLLSLKEAYDLATLDAVVYAGHINIGHARAPRTLDNYDLYETTTVGSHRWVTAKSYYAGTSGLQGTPEKLEHILNSRADLVAYAIHDHIPRLVERRLGREVKYIDEESRRVREEIAVALLQDTGREVWEGIPLLQRLWDISRLPPAEVTSYAVQSETLRQLRDFVRATPDLSRLFFAVDAFINASGDYVHLAISNFAVVLSQGVERQLTENPLDSLARISAFLKQGYTMKFDIAQPLGEEKLSLDGLYEKARSGLCQLKEMKSAFAGPPENRRWVVSNGEPPFVVTLELRVGAKNASAVINSPNNEIPVPSQVGELAFRPLPGQPATLSFEIVDKDGCDVGGSLTTWLP